MKWLFIHQNFPGQYVHLVRHLANAGHQVVFLTQNRNPSINGVRNVVYAPEHTPFPGHHYLRELDGGITNGRAVARACQRLSVEGFVPDAVIGHNGWGEILFVKDVWPDVPLLGYFEFFYHSRDSDVDFDPEFPPHPDDAMRLRTRNTINLLGLDACDHGQTPTRWQQSRYPEIYRARISVVHEGIDTDALQPNPTAQVWLPSGITLSRADEVITYSARNLEPYRGFHNFMRALPLVLRRRPHAEAIILGGLEVSYGRRPEGAKNWREKMLAELGSELDLKRVHFIGRLAYEQYLAILRLSSVHVYLTYPFVLSWSLLEAMSLGCLILGSRTPPVEEVIQDGENGHLVDFFDVPALAGRIEDALENRRSYERIRATARETVVSRYDLRRVCLPQQLALLSGLTGMRV